jgi:hypothetical protein
MNRRNYFGGGLPLRPVRRGPEGPLSPKRRAGQTERMIAALCHLSIVANIFTYAGGLGVCLLAYLFALGGAEFLAKQAGKALVAQLIVWGLILPAWFLQQLLPNWLGGIFFWPWCVLVWLVAVTIELIKAAVCL